MPMQTWPGSTVGFGPWIRNARDKLKGVGMAPDAVHLEILIVLFGNESQDG